LAEDGFVIVVVAIDSTGRLIRDPRSTRGLVHVDASQDVLDGIPRGVANLCDRSTLTLIPKRK
jgi:mRNA degradation ribonuclease J1/J2